MLIHLLLRKPSPQQLRRVIRERDGVRREDLEGVYFVPFVGGS